MIFSNQQNILTRYGNEYKALARLGAPVLVTQIGIIAVSFADTMMVGAYGTRELAAASFVNNIFLVAIVSLLGFGGGMTPVVGALFGNGKLKEAGTAFRSGLVQNTSTALAFFTAMGVVYFLLPYFGQPPELLDLIKRYYPLILASIIPSAIFTCGQNASNGMTDTAMPMWIMVSGNILNIIGNYLLIFGKFGCPELGLVGAGISTLGARILMAIAIVCGFALRKRYSALRQGWGVKADKATRRHVWTTSYPIMIQCGIECSLWALGAVVCGWFGTAQLASYQVANIIGQFGFMIYLSAGTALSIRVANFTGQHDIQGIRKATTAGLHLMLFMATLASVSFIIGGRNLIGLFTSDEAVIAAGIPLIIPLVLYQYFDATQLTYGCALRGTGYVKPLITVAVVSYIVVGISSLFILAEGCGLQHVGIYYSFSVTLLCAAVMLAYYFRKALSRL